MAGELAAAFDGVGTGSVGVGCIHGLLLVFLLLHHWRATVLFRKRFERLSGCSGGVRRSICARLCGLHADAGNWASGGNGRALRRLAYRNRRRIYFPTHQRRGCLPQHSHGGIVVFIDFRF